MHGALGTRPDHGVRRAARRSFRERRDNGHVYLPRAVRTITVNGVNIYADCEFTERRAIRFGLIKRSAEQTTVVSLRQTAADPGVYSWLIA